jgi:hypothetical protein
MVDGGLIPLSATRTLEPCVHGWLHRTLETVVADRQLRYETMKIRCLDAKARTSRTRLPRQPVQSGLKHKLRMVSSRMGLGRANETNMSRASENRSSFRLPRRYIHRSLQNEEYCGGGSQPWARTGGQRPAPFRAPSRFSTPWPHDSQPGSRLDAFSQQVSGSSYRPGTGGQPLNSVRKVFPT